MVDKAIQSGMRRILVADNNVEVLTKEPNSGEQMLEMMKEETAAENGSQDMKQEVPYGYVEEIEAEPSVQTISQTSSDDDVEETSSN